MSKNIEEIISEKILGESNEVSATEVKVSGDYIGISIRFSPEYKKKECKINIGSYSDSAFQKHSLKAFFPDLYADDLTKEEYTKISGKLSSVNKVLADKVQKIIQDAENKMLAEIEVATKSYLKI